MCIDSNLDYSIKISLLNAIMIYDDWNKISQSTIHNCNKQVEFVQNNVTSLSEEFAVPDTDYNDKNDVTLSLCVRNYNSNHLVSPRMREVSVDFDSDLIETN